MIIGVSLKAYFGFEQTRDWCTQVAWLMTSRGPDTAAGPEVFVLPAYPVIPAAITALAGSGVSVGAQTVSPYPDGAYTGEVTATLLAEIGCRYVAVGHADRRRLHGENDEIVAAQVSAVLANRLCPVICIGETERSDAATAAAYCRGQIMAALADAIAAGATGHIVVAYEPVWAIGASQPAPESYIREVCESIRAQLAGGLAATSSRVIYGGAAGPGLLGRLRGSVDGLFLGRFAHDVSGLASVLDEARHRLT